MKWAGATLIGVGLGLILAQLVGWGYGMGGGILIGSGIGLIANSSCCHHPDK